jgi:hypothetical protein
VSAIREFVLVVGECVFCCEDESVVFGVVGVCVCVSRNVSLVAI